MGALLAAYHHAHKYKTGRRYEGEWGKVCKAVEILLTVRDMNRFKRFCGRKDLRSYVKCGTSACATSTNLSIKGEDYLPWPVLVTLRR